MNKLNIIGIGPGNPDYILNSAIDAIKKSDVVIGGKRNLDNIPFYPNEKIEIKKDLNKTIKYIKKNINKKKITVIASGDPGFFSILSTIKKHFDIERLNIIPGISSMQYIFSKIGLTWEDAVFFSLHGKKTDVVNAVKKNKKIIFLTDNKHTPQYIAEILFKAGMNKVIMYIGNNLSYDDEVIIKDSPENILNNKENFNLSIVVIINE